MEKIQKLFKEVIERMRKDGFPISENISSLIETMDSKRYLGFCRFRHGQYYIYINKKFVGVADTEQNVIKSVLTHELIHTIHGCMNHKAGFKSYATRANQLYTEIDVWTRATSLEHNTFHKLMENEAPYAYKCLACGRENLAYRKTNFIKQILGETRNGRVAYTCICQRGKQKTDKDGKTITTFVLTKNKGKKVFVIPKNISQTVLPTQTEEVFYKGNEILLFDISEFETTKPQKRVACASNNVRKQKTI